MGRGRRDLECARAGDGWVNDGVPRQWKRKYKRTVSPCPPLLLQVELLVMKALSLGLVKGKSVSWEELFEAILLKFHTPFHLM